MPKPDWVIPPRDHEFLLESDSSNRGDSQKIRAKNYEEAERLKHEAEELQRNDKHLRTTTAAARNKK